MVRFPSSDDERLCQWFREVDTTSARGFCDETRISKPKRFLAELDNDLKYKIEVEGASRARDDDEEAVPEIESSEIRVNDDDEKLRRFRLPVDDPQFKLPPRYDNQNDFALDRWLYEKRPETKWAEVIGELDLK